MMSSTHNLFSGNPFNRLSWLRPSHTFLNAAITSSATRWILFNSGNSLIISHPQTRKCVLAYLTTTDVAPLLGSEPYFGQGDCEGKLIEPDATNPALESARHRGPRIVFLGLLEPDASMAMTLLSSDFKGSHAAIANINGTLYFAMDVVGLEPEKVEKVLKDSRCVEDGETLLWRDLRTVIANLDHSLAGMFAQARSMVDWNHRNKASAKYLYASQ